MALPYPPADERPIRGHPGRGLEEWLERQFPSSFARFYRLSAGWAMRSFYLSVAREIVANLKEGRVLDIGTGPGMMPQELARIAPNLEVMGIDLSPAMVSLAHEKTSRLAGFPSPAFLGADAAHLPFADNTFDLVVVTLSLHHWPRQADGLASVYRVLKPGGSAWIHEPRYRTGCSDFQKLVSGTPFQTWNYQERQVRFGFLRGRLSLMQMEKEFGKSGSRSE